jgi:hypothetical protein
MRTFPETVQKDDVPVHIDLISIVLVHIYHITEDIHQQANVDHISHLEFDRNTYLDQHCDVESHADEADRSDSEQQSIDVQDWNLQKKGHLDGNDDGKIHRAPKNNLWAVVEGAEIVHKKGN